MTDDSLKRQALFLQALGMCRGLLYSVRAGDVDIEEVDRVLRATSLANIARVLGVDEGDIALDSEEHLSPNERLDS